MTPTRHHRNSWSRLVAANPVRGTVAGRLASPDQATARLERIIRQPLSEPAPPRRPRSRRRFGLVLAGATLALAGVAGASGVIPDVIRDQLGDLDAPKGNKYHMLMDRVHSQSIPTPDGGRLVLWIAPTEGGLDCVFLSDDEPRDSDGRGCLLLAPGKLFLAAANPDDEEDLGFFASGPAKTATIEVTYENGFARTIPVRDRYGLALASPADRSSDVSRLVARDSAGRVLARCRGLDCYSTS